MVHFRNNIVVVKAAVVTVFELNNIIWNNIVYIIII